MNVDELAILFGKRVSVNWSEHCKDFYASIDGLYVIEGCCLSTATGRGSSPEEAKKNYGRELAGKKAQFGMTDGLKLNIPETME